jgi:hypothetical protein
VAQHLLHHLRVFTVLQPSRSHWRHSRGCETPEIRPHHEVCDSGVHLAWSESLPKRQPEEPRPEPAVTTQEDTTEAIQSRGAPSSTSIGSNLRYPTRPCCLLQQDCNRADMCRCALDKVRQPDRRKPPKQRYSWTHQYKLKDTIDLTLRPLDCSLLMGARLPLPRSRTLPRRRHPLMAPRTDIAALSSRRVSWPLRCVSPSLCPIGQGDRDIGRTSSPSISLRDVSRGHRRFIRNSLTCV